MCISYKDFHQNAVRTGTKSFRTGTNSVRNYAFHTRISTKSCFVPPFVLVRNRFVLVRTRFEIMHFIQGFPLKAVSYQFEPNWYQYEFWPVVEIFGKTFITALCDFCELWCVRVCQCDVIYIYIYIYISTHHIRKCSETHVGESGALQAWK